MFCDEDEDAGTELVELEVLTDKNKIIDRKIFENNLKAICYIESGSKKGSGFFCMIPDPEEKNKRIKVLLTCYHVVNTKETDKIYYNLINQEKKELSIRNRRKWSDQKIDYTCIQLLEEDSINNYLNIDENLLNNKNAENNLINKIVLIYTRFELEQMSFGTIEKFIEYDLLYTNDTLNGWSGSPVILKENNEVIAIHKNGIKGKNYNKGGYIKSILSHIKTQKRIQFDEKSKNNNSSVFSFCKEHLRSIIIILILLAILIYLLKINETKNSIINDKDKKIEDKDLIIQTKDDIIQKITTEKEDIIKEKEKIIEDKDKTIQEKVKDIEKYNYHIETLEIPAFLNKGNKIESQTYTIKSEGMYRICVYGATAKNGGKGGKQCAEHYFEKNSIINFYYEGQESGGEGGKKCGWNGGNGFNGAGLSKAEYGKDFLIIGGGGGGNSEDNKNKGGDFNENGKGNKGGKSGLYNQQINNRKGGNGKNNGSWKMYCGGGGGNGYNGGEGGDYGNEKEVGGGGGGSNYCKARHCMESEVNHKTYSGFEIYKKY